MFTIFDFKPGDRVVLNRTFRPREGAATMGTIDSVNVMREIINVQLANRPKDACYEYNPDWWEPARLQEVL